MKIITGSDLRKMRKEAGLSQEKLAEKLHIARSSISKLERGQLELRVSDLFRWMNVTQSQEYVAAIILGIDVGILQQALDMISTMPTLVGMIGGVL